MNQKDDFSMPLYDVKQIMCITHKKCDIIFGI